MSEEIPKELTIDTIILLGLVLEKCVCGISELEDWNYENEMHYNYFDGGVEDNNMQDGFINIDTLTIKMLDWCVTDGEYIYLKTINRKDMKINQCVVYLSTEQQKEIYDESKFEAVLKITHWVAKQKGLL